MSTKEKSYAEKEQRFYDVDQEKDVINFLDIHSLAEIFLLLPIPERMAMNEVCPKWKEACKLAWYNIKKYKCTHTIGRAYNNQLLTQSYVEKLLLQCGTYLNELSLSKICNASIMPIVAEHCENLTRLEFVHNGNLKTNVNHYIETFTKLKKLKFIKVKLINMHWCLRRKFPWKVVNYLPEGINEIHFIDQQLQLSQKPVLFDLKRFKNLYALTLSGCNLNNILHEISEKTSLIYLDLTNSSVTNKCEFDVDNLFKQLVNLEHIDITITHNLSLVVNCILNTCKNIKHLDLKSWGWNTQEEVEISIESWDNLKNLEYLRINLKITEEIAIQLVKYCKKLQYLNIPEMHMDNARQTALQELTKLENLESLKIGYLNDFSSETIAAITNNCKKLKILKLYSSLNNRNWNNRESRPSLVFEDLSKLQNLEQLSLQSMITNESFDSSIIAIVDSCKSLTKLDIGSCYDVTETTLIALTNSESLKELKVDHIDSVTDNFISKLKGLQCFDCTGCKKITDAGVIQLIKNCPDLENLDLDYTHVTTNTIIGASEATKNRRNNIILILDVDRILKRSFKSLNKSIWLALRR